MRGKAGIFIGRLGILLFFVLICQANLFHYNYRMNADIASEALLGQVIWNSKQWVPDMWYPSTEVRLIGTANLSALFYGLCGSLKLAMGLACVVFVLWIIFEIVYLFKEAEGGGKTILFIFDFTHAGASCGL